MSWLNILRNPKTAGNVLKTISSVNPLSKIKGAMSVSDAKNKASLASLKAAGDSAVRRLKDTTKSLNKLNETLKKQKKVLDK